MKASLTMPSWLMAALAGVLGFSGGGLWRASSGANRLERSVVEGLVMDAPQAELDGRRLRWLVQSGTEPVAAWAREELVILEARRSSKVPALDEPILSPAVWSMATPVAVESVPPNAELPEVVAAAHVVHAPVVVKPEIVEPKSVDVEPAIATAEELEAHIEHAVPSVAEAPETAAEASGASETAPEAPETRSKKPETAPEAPETASEEPGIAPEEPETSPEEAETSPEEPGIAPEEPEPAPEAPKGSEATPPPPVLSGLVSSGTITLYGGLDPLDAQEAFDTRNRRWKRCYDQALVTNPTAAGIVELSFPVSHGHVTGLEVSVDDVGDRTLTRCLSGVARMMHFEEDGEMVLPLILSIADIGVAGTGTADTRVAGADGSP